MLRLEQQIVEILARNDHEPQQKLDLIFKLQQSFNQLKLETNTLTGLTFAKRAASQEVDAGKAAPNKATLKQQPVTNGSVKIAVQPVPIAQLQNSGQADEYYWQQPSNNSPQRF